MSLQTGNTMNNTIQSIFESIFGRNFKYGKEITGAVLAALLASAGYFGYRWYSVHQEEVAQQLFAHNVEEFDRVMQEGKKEDWANIESLFKLGYEQYSGTGLAPFFLVYQSQAMLKQEKHKEAFDVFESAVNKMKSDAPLTGVYKTSLALMRLDSQDQTMREVGLKDLENLTKDSMSTSYDIASYYLGLYYMTNNDSAKATEIWQKLIDSQKIVAKAGQSPWAMMAQQKLGQPIE